MKPIDREARRVLEAAREAMGPSDREREVARQRFAAALGVVPLGVGMGVGWWSSAGVAAAAQAGGATGAAGAAAGTATAGTAVGAAIGTGGAAAGGSTAGAATSAVGVLAAKWLAGGFIVASSAAGVVYGGNALTSASSESRVTVAAVSPHHSRTAPANPRAVNPLTREANRREPPFPEPTPVGRMPDWSPPDPVEPSAVPMQHVLGEELALVRQVDSALRSGSPRRALDLLRGAEARFAQGELGEERQALGIIALCALDPAAGGARGAAFLASHPSSVYAPRLRDACRPVSDRMPPANAREKAKPESVDTEPPFALPRQRFDDVESP